MKEHPDYKYRPRRKPKSLVKKENKFGFSLSPLMSTSDTLTNISRGLLPPLAPPAHHALLGQEDLKIPRFFPPFPYPLYPIQHKLGEDFTGSKLAADLAFQAIYGSGTFYSSHQAVAAAWPGLTTTSCIQPNCGCPSSPSKEPKRSAGYLHQSKPDERSFGNGVKPEVDHFQPETRETSEAEDRYRKLDDIYASSLDKHDEAKSEDRYSSSPSVDRFEKIVATAVKPENTFSVQSLTASPSTVPRTHVI